LASSLAHVALAAVTALSWLGLGSLLLRRFPASRDRLLDTLNRIGVGALAFALFTFAIGWAGLLYAPVYLPVLAATAAKGITVAARELHVGLKRPLRWRKWELALVALLCLYVVLDLVVAAAPISSPDALLYHAADPARFEHAHQIVEVPSNSSSYEPFTVEMLVLDGFLLWDSVQGAFAPLLLSFVSLVAVVGASARLAGRSVALLAGAIFFAQPFMTWEATSVFVEPGLACMVALSGWNLARFARGGERHALVLAGLFAGGAAGMKYLGVLAALALGLAGALALRPRLDARAALSLAAPAIAIALPWYVKNAILTGNPFYPHVFGGLNPYAAARLDETRRDFGFGRSLLDLVLLPFRLLGDAESFDAGQWISPLFILFAPLVFLLPAARRVAMAVWAAVGLYVLAWFFATQQARFLVPAMPALALLAALGILALAQRGSAGRAVAAISTAAALAVGVAASLAYAAQFVPVVVGREPKEEFLLENAPYYAGIEWLDRRLGSDDRVLTDLPDLLYLEMPYTTFGTMGDLLPPTAGADRTRAFVRATGAKYAAVLARHQDRVRQLEYVDARLIARVSVRNVTSRTLSDLGPPETLLVYSLPTRK
jgi:hypothetical protein